MDAYYFPGIMLWNGDTNQNRFQYNCLKFHSLLERVNLFKVLQCIVLKANKLWSKYYRGIKIWKKLYRHDQFCLQNISPLNFLFSNSEVIKIWTNILPEGLEKISCILRSNWLLIHHFIKWMNKWINKMFMVMAPAVTWEVSPEVV